MVNQNWIATALREDFDPRIKQHRKDPASSKQTEKNIAAFDFETSHGDAVITSIGYYDSKDGVWRGEAFDHREKPFTVKWFMAMCYAKMGYVHSRTEKKRRVHRMTVPNIFAWNLNFEQGTALKGLPDATINYLRRNGGCVIDVETGELNLEIYKSEGRWTWDRKEKIPRNQFVSLFFIPKKMLTIEPIGWTTTVGDKRGVRLQKIICYDIAQFYGGSLNKHAKRVLNDTKVDGIDRAMLGSNAPTHPYWTTNWSHIWEYAIHDSVLTAHLAWLKVKAFESNGVRMNKPISCASVAERSVYDLCHLPTINNMWKNRPDVIKWFWTAYQGGWFESTGSGYLEDVKAYDLASAYPHVMWWLPDWTGGLWYQSDDFGEDEYEDAIWDYLRNHHQLYRLCVVEAVVDFPEGRPLYPAAKRSDSMGCVINAQSVEGFFTGDEILEFERWGATIQVGRWSYHIPADNHDNTERDVQDGIRYPLRPFIETFYGMKLRESAKKKACPDCREDKPCSNDACTFDKDAYNVSKVMINSTYGKLMAGVDTWVADDRILKTGNMWNPMWAAVTTAGCRMRLAEMIRVNGYDNTVSVATDGIILKGDDIVVPENPAPAVFRTFNDDGEETARETVNLGDWEDDGRGNLILLMSGVYSVIKPHLEDEEGNIPTKSTYRGNYSLFIGRSPTDYFPMDWFSFCEEYGGETEVKRDADHQPHSRPYSLGEAAVRKDFSLTNDFRIVDQTVRAMGDSNKRSWYGCDKPATFGDLLASWWPSETHDEVL
jgi:hypothetical protein